LSTAGGRGEGIAVAAKWAARGRPLTPRLMVHMDPREPGADRRHAETLSLPPVFKIGNAYVASALAGSTPAPLRIQHEVDHRFYRGNYDAARTLAAFTGRLRAQIELDTLSAVLTVVASTPPSTL
jgi:hypothetical protein